MRPISGGTKDVALEDRRGRLTIKFRVIISKRSGKQVTEREGGAGAGIRTILSHTCA